MSTREALPNRRHSESFEMQWGGQNTTFQVSLGYYQDRRIGEVFISGAKAGSDLDATARDGAILLSLALQHGVPLEVIRHAITRNHDNTPSTIIGAVVDRIGDEECSSVS